MYKHQTLFGRFARKAAYATGHPLAFIGAAAAVLVWAASGPLFGFGDTWQLVVNTVTTVITFLMVFLIQSSQNRDTAAVQIKLDELIRVNEKASKLLLDLEELEEKELEQIRRRYEMLAAGARSVGAPQDTIMPEAT